MFLNILHIMLSMKPHTSYTTYSQKNHNKYHINRRRTYFGWNLYDESDYNVYARKQITLNEITRQNKFGDIKNVPDRRPMLSLYNVYQIHFVLIHEQFV